MITNVSAGIVTEMLAIMAGRFRYVSLLEHIPSGMTTHTETTSRMYARQPVAWDATTAGLLVNDALLTFDGLESPLVIHALGLHDQRTGTDLLAWGAFSTPQRISGSRLVVKKGTISVRLI